MPGQGSITGKGLAVAFAGGILLWSGLKGKQASSVLRNVIAGKNPSGAANAGTLSSSAGNAGSAVTAGPVVGISTAAAINKAIVRSVAAGYGWSTGAQFTALDNVVMSESGYRNTAQNPTSTAYGMFQFLDTTWATVGGTKTSNPMIQAILGLKYIKQRYGTPERAWAFHQANNYY